MDEGRNSPDKTRGKRAGGKTRLVAIVGIAFATGVVTPVPDIPKAKYDRKNWKHWVDADKDCQDTRQEVLISESDVLVTFKDGKECKVASGRWLCPYTDQMFTDPRKLDVDHMVTLRDAFDSGGNNWDPEHRKEFANNLNQPDALIAVSLSANRSKGSKGPNKWLPLNEAYRCEYTQKWRHIKISNDLVLNPVQEALVAYILKLCDQGIIPPLPQKER
jgi:hypothetical protein